MYRVSRATITTKEEKVAAKIAGLLNDFTLDLNAVGKYLDKAVPNISYLRALEVLESMQYNRDVAEYDDRMKAYERRPAK